MLGTIQEELFLDFYNSIRSEDYKERGHALRVLEKMMPVIELARLEDAARTVKNIEDTVPMDDLLKKRLTELENAEETLKQETPTDATDTDTG